MVKISATTLLLLFGGAVISVAAQRCGPQAGNAICAAGNCCSQYGWCDVTPAHCDPANCQHAFSGAGSSCAGATVPPVTPPVTPPPVNPPPVTPPGQFLTTIPSIDVCGSAIGGVSCPGAGLGGYFYRCCSVNGHCGPKNSEQSQSDYCGAGCQAGYGSCDTTRIVPPPPAAAPTLSQDGHCGPIPNTKCPSGLCCSGSNYCGTGVDFCGAANFCQVNFGTCNR